MRYHLRDVDSQSAVDAGTLDADHDHQIQRNPIGICNRSIELVETLAVWKPGLTRGAAIRTHRIPGDASHLSGRSH